MNISSVQNPLIKQMAKLHQKKYRDEMNLFVVEGYHLYEEAVKVGNVKTVFTTNESIVGDHVVYVSYSVLQKLTQTSNSLEWQLANTANKNSSIDILVWV